VSVFNPALSSATFDGEKEHPGANIEKIPAPTLYPLTAPADTTGYVHLKWTSVPGAEGYEVFSTKNLDTLFTNTPLSVLPTSSSTTGVTVLPASATEAYVPASSTEALWYAVSTVVGGHLELESSPMVKASAPVSTVPTVSSVSPASGSVSGGTHIRIIGKGFVPGAGVVIGQGSGAGPTAIAASEVVVVSSTEITATTGGGAKAGTSNLFVIDSGGTSLGNPADDYTYK
jgi:IPT/TIG domain